MAQEPTLSVDQRTEAATDLPSKPERRWSPKPRAPAWYLGWVLACIVGATLTQPFIPTWLPAFVVIHVVAGFLIQPEVAWLFGAGTVFLSGVFGGAAFALPQWLLLRSWARRRGWRAAWWVPATALACGPAWVVFFYDAGAKSWWLGVLSFALGGAVIGLAQGTALRSSVHQPLRWVPDSVLGWVLFWMPSIIHLAFGIHQSAWLGDRMEWLLPLSGAAYGSTTGLALLLLLRDEPET